MLSALDAGEPVRWVAAKDTDLGEAPGWRAHRGLVGSIALLTLIGATVVLSTQRPVIEPEPGMLATLPSPRLKEIATDVRPQQGDVHLPIQHVADLSGSAEQKVGLVVAPELQVEAGTRTQLSAEVTNPDKAEPETVTIVRGLPEDVELSDGIQIGPGLWMLRPSLLASVEIDAAESAHGQHDVVLELRSPTGRIVSATHTVLTITPVGRPASERADDASRVAQEPAERRTAPQRQTSKPARAAAPAVESPAAPVRKRTAKARTRPAPVVEEVIEEQVAAPAKPTAKPRPERHASPAKTARKSRPVQSQVTVLSARPAPRQRPEPPRLVWPGDDPRSEAYLPSGMSYLGGAAPDAAPARGRRGWRARAFGN